MEKAGEVMTPIGEEPLVSVITPVYNGSEYLDELISSVQQQDYPHIEHIVIDDGSTDDGATVAVLKRYPHLRWWSRENKGQYATLNEGLAAARGSVIGIISADDKYVVPSAVSAVIGFWQSHPECGCIYGRTLRMDINGTLLPLDPTLRQGPFPAWYFRYSLPVSHCSLFVARSLVVDKGIWFDPSFRYAGDWDWIIRLSQACGFGYLDRPLSMYREHPVQATRQASQKNWSLEVRKILEHYHANHALYWFLVYQHRIRKGLWILRTNGYRGLLAAAKFWLNRR
jgi:glycosyltransferase involved in cell wall biosynthesis